MKNLIYSAYIVLLLLCISCKKEESKSIFDEIDLLTEHHPDSALNLLNTIHSVENLSTEMYMQYYLYNIKIKDKIGLKISGDTFITFAGKYFSEKMEYTKSATAYYYSGLICVEQEDLRKAMEYFIKALDIAQNDSSANYNLLGSIHYSQASLYKDQMYYNDVLRLYLKSQQFFNKAGNTQKENQTIIALADTYMLTGHYNEALSHYNNALTYSRKNNDSLSISEVMKKAGNIYSKMGDFKKAKDSILECTRINASTEDTISNSILLSEIYAQLNIPDSAHFYRELYRERIINSSDYSLKYRYFDSLSKEEIQQKKFEKALTHCQLAYSYKDSVLLNAKENFILEIDKKHHVKKINDSLDKLTAHNKYLMIIGAIFLLSTGIFWGLAERNISRMKKKIIENENLTADYEKKRERVKNLLFQRFEITKKLAVMNSLTDDKEHRALKKINEIIYGEPITSFNWDEFYILFDELYDGLSTKLPQTYPQLSTIEIHLCCLIQAKFDSGDLSFILNVAPITIRMRKTAIRKKLGIKDGSDLKLFFNQLIKKQPGINPEVS